MRPRPLTKPQREILNLCRGDGATWAELHQGRHMRLAWQVQVKGWIDWRPPERGEDGKPKGPTIFFITPAGEAKLVELAPPPPAGRLACVNPRCWKTFSREKNPNSIELVCGPCWRSVPEIRRERKELDALWRKTERARRRRGDESTNETLRLIGAKIDANWSRMVGFFTAPEKPEGLDTFLEEMGWNDESTGDEHADRAEGA